jgi:aspartyl/asparaginyl-tRNA synthetase
MSQIANITVYDGAATPVSHTLVAMSVTREKSKITAQWQEQIASLPTEAQVRATATVEKLKSGVTKVELRVEVPVMESVSGNNAAGYTAAPKVAYIDTFIESGYYHPRSNTAGRRLVRQLGLNLGGNISTSVAPATTGPIPELFDMLVSPT